MRLFAVFMIMGVGMLAGMLVLALVSGAARLFVRN